MSGCFGNHPFDRAMERQLDRWLDQRDKEEQAYEEWFNDLSVYMNWNQEEYDEWYDSDTLWNWFQKDRTPKDAFIMLQDEEFE